MKKKKMKKVDTYLQLGHSRPLRQWVVKAGDLAPFYRTMTVVASFAGAPITHPRCVCRTLRFPLQHAAPLLFLAGICQIRRPNLEGLSVVSYQLPHYPLKSLLSFLAFQHYSVDYFVLSVAVAGSSVLLGYRRPVVLLSSRH